MMKEFKGIVNISGDPYRQQDDPNNNGALWVGTSDVLEELDDKDLTCGIVAVTLNGTLIGSGRLFVEWGWGYSEYTPMDSDVLKVDDLDLLELMKPYSGKEVTLTVESVP